MNPNNIEQDLLKEIEELKGQEANIESLQEIEDAAEHHDFPEVLAEAQKAIEDIKSQATETAQAVAAVEDNVEHEGGTGTDVEEFTGGLKKKMEDVAEQGKDDIEKISTVDLEDPLSKSPIEEVENTIDPATANLENSNTETQETTPEEAAISHAREVYDKWHKDGDIAGKHYDELLEKYTEDEINELYKDPTFELRKLNAATEQSKQKWEATRMELNKLEEQDLSSHLRKDPEYKNLEETLDKAETSHQEVINEWGRARRDNKDRPDYEAVVSNDLKQKFSPEVERLKREIEVAKSALGKKRYALEPAARKNMRSYSIM